MKWQQSIFCLLKQKNAKKQQTLIRERFQSIIVVPRRGVQQPKCPEALTTVRVAEANAAIADAGAALAAAAAAIGEQQRAIGVGAA